MSKKIEQLKKDTKIVERHLVHYDPEELLAVYLAAKTQSDPNTIRERVILEVWLNAIQAIETLIEHLESEEE